MSTTTITDDKSPHVIPFLLSHLAAHREKHAAAGTAPPPFFLGLNGVQGAGKTTLVSTLATTLRAPPHSLPTAVLSLDDFYLPHAALTALAESTSNPLLQHRGQPPTHDLALGASVFEALKSRAPVALPQYDKSAYAGQGDRADPTTWERVNEGEEKIEVVVFEGWSVGFRSLEEKEVEAKWVAARQAEDEAERKGEEGEGQLGKHKLWDLLEVNEALVGYDVFTDALDAFVHIDAEDTRYVYAWRLEQEAALRASKGTGMTDEQVVSFVNGYYPAYELYTPSLRRGLFASNTGAQMRLVVGRDRKVKQAEVI
ncbi:putative Uridine/cytidine kinase [Lophium mytilinum]|uniref:Putative Uridine/cytidine kinase n=1 Tax=Lophium mytilinum TaxID=390894 RepID=A0A6A6QD11_9PEZI|nr:putative Uridine/cytidine kinase [Lophium mytilinum]